MDYKTLYNNYNEIVTRNYDTINGDAKIILGRGLVVCNNDNVKSPILMLTGINPSFNQNHPEAVEFDFATAKGSYWRKKHNQFGGQDSSLVKNHMAYLDLFPLRERYQKIFEKAFYSYNRFRFEMLSQTANALERIQPKLIVHANKSSLFYWGLNPITFEMDTVNSWLGYNFSAVDNCPILETYHKRVSEFRDENGMPVSKEKRYVHLFKISGRGLKQPVFFLTYIMEYYGMKPWQTVQLFSSKEMNELWEWCKVN